MTEHGLLLAFLSELGSGSWTRFRAALDAVAGEEDERMPSLRAQGLAALGHVEFAFYGDLRWAACPPVLAWLPGQDDPAAVLCGARTDLLVDRFHERAEKLGLLTKGRTQPENAGPEALFVHAPEREAGEELARLMDLSIQDNAAGLIARCLPSLAGYFRLAREVPGPSGYEIEAFDAPSLRWTEARDTQADGLYRYKYYWPEYRLRTGGRDLKVARETGIYTVLHRERRKVLRYDPTRCELAVPVAAPLPELHARAATLCSGLLPGFERRDGVPYRLYGGVPDGIALAIFETLEQNMEAQR